MQIINKKEITTSPASGTAVEVRKGNIAKWSGSASVNHTPTSLGPTQIGSSLKLVSTGKPIRVRADLFSQIGDLTTQQNAAAQSTFTITKAVNGVDVSTVGSRQITDILVKLYAAGSLSDYVGTKQAISINLVDDSASSHVDGDVVEYKIGVSTGYFSYGVSNATPFHSLGVYSFEIEEVA